LVEDGAVKLNATIKNIKGDTQKDIKIFLKFYLIIKLI